MANLPADIGNQALDAAGVDFTMGDLSEGTKPAQVVLRQYRECRRQLLRAAHWSWSRKQIPLVLLADITGNTPNVGTNVVQAGFTFEYAMPPDFLKDWYVPWQPFTQPGVAATNIVPQNSGVPLMTGLGQPPYSAWRPQPARFLIATDSNYPPPPGVPGDDELPAGVSPVTQTVLLTNVQNAQLVYTADMIYPSVWDPLFRSALVAYLASEIALPLAKDKKLGKVLRDDQIAVAKAKIQQARLTDGNSGVSDSTLSVDWMQTRRTGGRGSEWGFGCGDGPGGFGAPWGSSYDTISFANGGSF